MERLIAPFRPAAHAQTFWRVLFLLWIGGAVSGQNTITIVSAEATRPPGVVTVGVTLDVGLDLSLLDLRIDYDPERLEIAATGVIADPERIGVGDTGIILVSAGAGIVKWSGGSLVGDSVVRSGTGPLLSLTFALRDGCPAGLTPLLWTTVRALDTHLEPVVFPNCVAGAISVQIFHTLSFLAGPHGRLTGDLLQTVSHGLDASTVTAIADADYHFVRWSDGSTANPRTDVHVVSDVNVTAQFASDTFTVAFSAGVGGTLLGNSLQTVAHGASALAVTAVADREFLFERWTSAGADYSTANPLTVTAVLQDASFVAVFRAAPPVSPTGTFTLSLPALAFANGAGIWDLSGHYVTDLGEDSLTLDLLHDARGGISGSARYTTNLPAKVAYTVPLQAVGRCTCRSGAMLVRLGADGQAVGIPSDADALAKVSVAQTLTLNASRATLVGTSRVRASLGSLKRALTTATDMALPAGVDGGWGITVDLSNDGGEVAGTGLLRLSSGATFRLLVSGRIRGDGSSLAFLGDKATDPAASGIEISALVEPLEDGSARVLHLRGKAFGQNMLWTR